MMDVVAWLKRVTDAAERQEAYAKDVQDHKENRHGPLYWRYLAVRWGFWVLVYAGIIYWFWG